MQENIVLAFLLTTLAGLSTVVGALLIFGFKNISSRFVSFGLGLSAGVMIYVSFFELLKESNLLLSVGESGYSFVVIFSFIAGLLVASFIDFLTHSRMDVCPKERCEKSNMSIDKVWHSHKHGRGCRKNFLQRQKLLKTGIFTAVVITVHNFPEGIITFTTASIDVVFGLSIAIAIAIHNIPEGFCIALPIYHATKSKKKALWYALLAGLAEPFGALMTYFILFPYLNDYVLGIMLAVVAGIMVYVSFDELLPTARRYGGHVSLYGLIAGMILMAFSLYLLH